jgi:hypothetical protein
MRRMITLGNARQVRAAARKKLLISSWLLFVIPAIVYLTEIFKELQPIIQFLVFGGAFLCTPFLMHLLELITGAPFTELSNRWDGLKGWQRGVIGITGCGFLITLIIVTMGTILPLIVI